MKALITDRNTPQGTYVSVDPTSFLEGEFEVEVVKALTCLYPDYLCGIFSGMFILEGDRRKCDIALIHKELYHWFVIEVELAGHSLDNHVLPQIRCFRYGEPDSTCVTSLMTAFDVLSREQAKAILTHVPRHIAVISNLHVPTWMTSLKALDTQHLVVTVFKNCDGDTIHEIDGKLIAKKNTIGFAIYSEIDKCMRIKSGCGIPPGVVEIIDQFGSITLWTVHEKDGVLWISKNEGIALLPHNCYVQINLTTDGRFVLKPS